MSSYQVIEDVQEQLNTSVVNSNIYSTSSSSSTALVQQIEKKRSIRTVGDWKYQSPLTTTATASSAKISVISTAERKSVVSSVSMSLERQDSIQYVPRKIPPCIIPAGQSTVIHLDNYKHFMAQRVTTTKTAIKRSEIIAEAQQKQNAVNVLSSTKSIVACSTSNSKGSKINSGGEVDVDLKVILGGVSSSSTSSSSYCNNKTLNMNKQKILDKNPAPRSKARGRKNSLALEYSQQTELNKMIDIKAVQEDPPPSNLKSILKKPKSNRRRKLFKPRATRKAKNKNEVVEKNNTNEGTMENKQISLPLTTAPGNSTKILRPCTYTMQSRKCLNEMTCPYLHSNFPCKYYYLNLQCPLDFKCQYMHNGPLEPILMEALRNHILDLLSTKPTVLETYFIQQLHNIEDLSHRLQSFQKISEEPQQVFEVIEVMDDEDDVGDEEEEEQVLVIDESNEDANVNISDPASVISITNSNTSDIEISTPETDKLDVVYQNFQETNIVIDEIDKKLKSLKNNTTMTANEKIQELQNIYELLKEQEKRLPIYENLNTENTEKIFKTSNIKQSNTTNEQNLYKSAPVTSIQNTNSVSHISEPLSNQPITDKFDIVYQNVKETNIIIDKMDQKLKTLKSTSNMNANEKLYELQNIYELLKEQEKRLPNQENLNNGNGEEIFKNYNNVTHSQSNEQLQHIVLVNPEIVNDIQISVSQENQVLTIMDDDEEELEQTNTNVPQGSGIKIISNEILPPAKSGIKDLFKENLRENVNVNNYNKEITNLIPEQKINDISPLINMDQEQELTNNVDSLENNTNIDDLYNTAKQNENNEQNSIVNNELNNTLNKEVIENLNNEQSEIESVESLKEILEKTISLEDLNNTQTQEEYNNSNTHQIQEEYNDLNNTISFNETLELAVTSDEKEVIESHIKEQETTENINEEESPPYEHIYTPKFLKISHIRLRSHTHQDITTTPNKTITKKSSTTTSDPIKPIKTRRLRLPKSTTKTTEKINNEECQINADIINKLIKSTENSDASRESTFLQDVEVPLTQNVILTKRFMKKAKAKLEQQLQLNDSYCSIKTPTKSDFNINVEQKIFALHHEDTGNLNSIENVDVNQLTQTSDDSQPLNSSQDPLIVENETHNVKESNDLAKTSSNLKKKSESLVTIPKNRRVSFENPTSSLASNNKEQYNLGNPHVVLTKLKPNILTATTQKDNIQADSTTTNNNNVNVNSLVTSSSPSTLLSGTEDKATQKRHSFTPEHDLDSSLTENKYLKIDNIKAVRKVNFDTRRRTYSGQSTSSKEEGEFDSDSSDEKLTIADALQISSASSTGCNEPSTTHNKPTTKHYYHQRYPAAFAVHQHVHKERQENESDLRQQIENVSNKSDLQHQRQKQERQQNIMEQASTVATATNINNTISITKNSNSNLPHKQYQLQQENEKNYHHYHIPQPQQQSEKNFKKEEKQIANTCNPYVNIEDRKIQSSISASMLSSFQSIDDAEDSERPSLNASDKKSNESLLVEKKEENIEYSTTYSSLYNKLSSSHSAKCQINFENSSVNITPISSPTYGDDTIASPSPVKKSIDFRMGGEIDGRLTYPPIPYILHEIDLGKIEINKPLYIDKLKKTIQLDPRIFRTHVKKQLMSLCKSTRKTSSLTNALVPFNTTNFSAAGASSIMVSPYDPRNRTPTAIMHTDMTTPTITAQHTALNSYNHMNVASPSSSSSYMANDIVPNAVPLALQYHNTTQPILQPQQQQTPNMFLYGCLQRSPWYQSLMSTMKIQINQSISQLVRALNNFHRERLINPELVFDVFKIDCAGELLEIMRNLGIFVDANGIINEHRHMPSFGGRSCCNTMPFNATYSFIQQVLTPNTHCTSLTTASSTYNTSGAGVGAAGGGTVDSSLNINEPFVSCYIKAPEIPQQKTSTDCCTTHNNHHQHQHHSTAQEDKHINNNNNSHAHNNCNYCRRTCNNNNTYNSCGNSGNKSNNNNGDSYGGTGSSSQNNNNGNNRRFGGFGDNKFKKPYDSYNNDNNSYRSSNQRSSYINNPRFSKPGLSSPSKSNNSPPNSPRGGGGGGYDGGSGNSFGGGGGGFRGGRGGGGRFNNNRRFNNYNNNDKFNGNGGSSWSSNNDSKVNRYNKFDNNSPTRSTSSPNKSFQSDSPGVKSSSSPARNTGGDKNRSDEECWD